MKGKITTRQMKLNCLIQAVLGCLPIPDPSLNQEAMKIMRIAARICKCMVAYLTRPNLLSHQPQYYSTILNSVVLAKCMSAQLWENSPFVSRQLKGIGPTYSNSLATAGKVNFMLLEESHPRDLERIMNKGPPAGNIIRKQISLLPKYKLTITPVDEKTVTIQLMLMNQSYLSENMDNLTAGDSHKSYVIVGDSENHILLLTTFVDKTLIKVYDGTLTFSVTRKHRCEHKIIAHCISSTYVGIDDHCDYLFKDLEPMPVCLPPTVTDSQRNIVSKQTNITDTFKERKRRGNNSIEISQCKEKKRRENALFEKLKLLKRSFSKTTKSLQEELNETTMSDLIPAELNDKEFPDYTNCISEELNEPTMSNLIPAELNEKEFIDFTNSMSEDVKAFEEDEEFEVLNYSKTGTIPTDCQYIDSIMNEYPEMDTEDGKFIDNGHINSILTEIENEISKKPWEPYLPNLNENNKHHIIGPLILKLPSSKVIHPKMGKPGNELQHQDSVKFQRTENYKVKNGLSRNTKRLNNYSFLDKIGNSSDDEVIIEKPVTKESGFSNAIKSHIQKFLQKSNNKVGMDSAVVIQKLLEPVSSAQTESIEEHSNTTHIETVLVSDNTEGDCILIENSQNRSSNISEKDMHTENICLDKPSQNSLIDIDQPIEINDIDQAVQPIYRTHDGNLEKDLTGIGNLFRSLSTSEKNEDVDTTIQGCYTLALNDKVYSDKTVNDTILNSDNKVEDACTDSIVIAGSQNRPSSNDELQKNDTTTEQYFKPIHPMINNKCSSSFAKPVPINSNHEECVETNAIQLPESSHALVPVKLQEFNSRAALLPKQYNQQVDLYFKTEKLKKLEEYGNEGNMDRMLVSEQYRLNSSDNQMPQHQYSEFVTGTQHTSSFSLDSRNRDGNAVPIHGNREKHVTINNSPYTENENMDFSKEISSPSTIPYCPAMQNNNFERIYEEECQPEINTKFESKKPKIMYTQKYSYVTTEIDIWTKNNSDENCTVKVIKKMEVNVAAIVSKDSDKKTYFSSDKKDKHIPLVRQAKPFEIKTNTSGLETEEIISEPKNKISNFIGNLNYSDTPSDRLATPLEIETKTSEIQEDPNNTNEGSIRIENNFQHENKMTDIKREKCTSENGPSAVDNLLKKYANILKEKAEQENCRTIQKHIPENKTNSQKLKPKRPFKISDIHRIDATLPNTLIDMTPRTITPIPDEGRNMIYKHTIDQKSSREPDFHQSMPIMEMKHVDPILNYSEPIVDNDNEISFNIDQSLLNPKSLLQQCYKNLDENEIIPPPSQFCDDSVYSPKKESNFYSDQSPAPHMLHNELESYCDTADEFDAKTYLDAVERSCYDNSEHEHGESTPSTNMEVWNLGTGEDACTSLPSFVRASDHFIPASKFNIGYNRKQKLGRYQLNTKAKFKVSRNKL
ncbi:uncharacterized protein LOC125488835 [Plutella xylostella]|uniref:uncharacterized protein LOC125488835 n=1 Tax=Plutella xylostella TaxID=51655 RepID=UPI002032B686|nr:uncharacterized protein LOC125488835 [Plutella xylostella]